MKTLRLTLIISFLFFQEIIFAQAPVLRSASSFAFFTSAGAFTNTGVSNITGDVGTNVGALTGFPPGIISGVIHVADATTASAATSVDTAYYSLKGVSCGTVLGTSLGNNNVLTPNVYCLGAASTLNGNLILDGQGDADALFIFQIDGALSTGTFSNVILINSAKLTNVYWQINGEFILGDSSVFMGTIINSGAITLLGGSSFFGRALSRAGAISLHTVFSIAAFSTLPIELTYIKVFNIDNRNRIEWVTETENKGEVFELERSANGKHFTSISVTSATGKPGLYSYWDEHPLYGLNQYRLKIKNTLGNFTYSPIVTITAKTKNELILTSYPNPVNKILTLAINGATGKHQTICISNQAGRKMKQLTTSGNRIEIDMTEFATGIYFIKYLDENCSKTIKIVKQ